jgi:putative transposase
MGRFFLAQVFSILITIVRIGRLSEEEKDQEILILRQQLGILQRKQEKPVKPNRAEKMMLAVLTAKLKEGTRRPASKLRGLIRIFQPETVLGWHRELYRRYWRRKSKPMKRGDRTSPEIIELIKQMARENRLWGAERIRGKLLKLGVKVSKRTIQKYMHKERRNRSGQTWSTFLKNHFRDIWACDFTVVNDLLFRSWYVFVIMELHTRRIVHAAVARSPTDEWVAQQLCEATPCGEGPKYPIRDRDNKYGKQFTAVAGGIEILKTPVRAPRANSYCERLIGSLRRECLDHKLIL